MKKIFSTLLFLSLLFSPLNHAQIVSKVEDDFLSFLHTGGNLCTSFTQFDKSTQIKTAGSLLFIAAAYSIDYNAKKFASLNHSNFNNSLFSIDKVYGSGYTLLGIGGLYGYGILFNNDNVRKLGLQTIEAVGYAGLITSILKAVVGRSRPYANEGKARFRPFNVHAAYTSFPSGHATVSFAVSTVLANNTNSLFLKILCYSASTLVLGARIYHNDHWLSDVITGGLIGHFVGDFVSSQNNGNNKRNSGLSIGFSFNSINLSYSF